MGVLRMITKSDKPDVPTGISFRGKEYKVDTKAEPPKVENFPTDLTPEELEVLGALGFKPESEPNPHGSTHQATMHAATPSKAS